MINAISNLPTPMKAGGGAVATGGVLGTAYVWFHDLTFILIIVGGILLLVLLYLAWKYYSRMGKSKNLKRILSGAQTGAVDTDDGSDVQSLKDEFYKGLQQFLTRAKNPESKPWYLVVGESSSGKTQAIISSQLRFIMKSAVGGLGGTMGMKWWFTQEAVILDTAGRLMLPPEQNQSSLAWREFLQILKKERSNCPINGLFLMISAQSLLEYSSEKINDVAGIIASRFEEVQDELGVRFPVYVFITKCDLINGFNEFFEDLSDPRLQNQMLGWSNPANLDEDFDPKLVDEHLEDIRQRMIRRRAKLMLNPPPSSDPNAKRLDQIDALFNLPDSITKIGSRLRLYLETIFAGGADEKHLFLRGIYFTCAKQLGAPIDADLAAALGIPLSQLPRERMKDTPRSFFLRDVFVEKAFREKGLVTRAHNVSADKVRKRAMILGSWIAVVCMLIGITLLNGYQLNNSLKPFKFFKPLSEEKNLPYKSAVIVAENLDKSPPFVYQQIPNIETDSQKLSAPDLLEQSQQLASKPISAPLMLKPIGLINSVISGSSLTESVHTAHSMLFESLVLQPLVHGVRHKIMAMSKQDWENLGDNKDNATDALVELIKIEKPRPSSGALLDLKAMFKFLLGDGYAKCDPDISKLDQVLAWTYDPSGGNAVWPPKALAGGAPAITQGVAGYIEFCQAFEHKSNESGNKILAIKDALTALKTAEEKLSNETVSEPVTESADYATQSASWLELARNVVDSGRKIDGLIRQLNNPRLGIGADSIDSLYRTSKTSSLEDICRGLQALRDQLPDTPGPLHDAWKSVNASMGGLAAKLDELKRPENTDILKLQELDADFLISGADLDAQRQKRYRIQCDTVRQAIDLFPGSPADPPDDAATPQAQADSNLPLDTALQASKAVLDRQIADWKKHSVDDAEDKKLNDLQLSCKAALNNLVRPKIRTDLLAAQIDKLKETADGWKLASKELEHRSISPGMGLRPAIAMTAMKGGTFQLEFSPELLKETRKTLDTVKAALKAGKLLDQDALQNRINGKTAAWNSYTAEYANYWSAGVLKDLTIQTDSWDSMLARLKSADSDADEVNDKLKQLGNQMLDSLKVLNVNDASELLPPGEIQLSEKVQRGLDRFKGSEFPDRCSKSTSRWRALNPDPVQARLTLLSLGGDGTTASEVFTRSYTVGVNKDSDYVVFYWQSLASALVDSLAASADQEARDTIVPKIADAQHFPLVRPDAPGGDTDLTADQLKAVKEAVNELSSADSSPTPSGDKDPLAPLATLKSLDQYSVWLKKVRPVLEFLPDPEKPLTFSVTLMTSSGGCKNNCHDFIVDQGNPSTAVYIYPTDPKLGTPIDRKLTLTGKPITIIATQPGIPFQTRKWPYGGDHYSLLRLILDKSNSVEVLADGWKVTLSGEVPILNGKPAAGTVVIQITLTGGKFKPPPTRDQWPDVAERLKPVADR